MGGLLTTWSKSFRLSILWQMSSNSLRMLSNEFFNLSKLWSMSKTLKITTASLLLFAWDYIMKSSAYSDFFVVVMKR
ncbi:hypothetical protein BpHYR1_011284 [Brachionus plicatilis]|uniref:Uncharacterized protein n=1 Tax=Brachionus plicatilis TaxID=10195 RepID=A0A3M7QTF0_BRAPC|nr:hypothetical protein BpHYR1_011284 [Brachionus plicatilis]